MKKVLITGTAGFIGFHLSRKLLNAGFEVHGFDGMTDYYDVNLKMRRQEILQKSSNFSYSKGMLEDNTLLEAVCDEFSPEVIVHLAAQAGVRYSLTNPRAYIDSNVMGSLNILEAARKLSVKHLLMASTSSVYGSNLDMPFRESDKTDTQLTIYAATKKANESMAHSYAHLWKLPITMFRFFTVYGPWGRPDLALFKFVDAILDGRPIDIYNNGDMYRDFTYVDDLVYAIQLLIEKPPVKVNLPKDIHELDSLSPVAPFRVVNIGNSDRVKLLDFVEEIEAVLDQKAIRNFMGMQQGDVPATWASTDLLYHLTGYRPNTSVDKGIREFVDWFRKYYEK